MASVADSSEDSSVGFLLAAKNADNTYAHNRNGIMTYTGSACNDSEFRTTALGRSNTYSPDGDYLSRLGTGTPLSLHLARHQSEPQTRSSPEQSFSDRCSAKRRFSLQLPSFDSLGISISQSVPCLKHVNTSLPREVYPAILQDQLPRGDSPNIALCSSVPPLTPPPEQIPVLTIDDQNYFSQSASTTYASTPQEGHESVALQAQNTPDCRVQGITMPSSTDLGSGSPLQRLPWIANASHEMVESLNSSFVRGAIQVISQTLPSQARDSRSKPTFEEVLEILQTEMTTSPYITITHAVPQARIMEELPKTPPTTPNFRHETHDYFADDMQTIFTHAAVVPIYHTYDRSESSMVGTLAHYIAAPCCVSVSILERYIPPTMPEEIEDFFSMSSRSYLVDRLSELSPQNGSLLLIYPTRAGGNTFTQRYLGPLIDPLLRRFVMLNGLSAGAADLMGNMTAVDSMIDFEDMRARIENLCQNLSARPSGRGPRSAFKVTHSESAKVILDRKTWIDWYVEQEQHRLKQNLVEYHQSGGRMPHSEDHREITVGMLTRDFIDAVNKSEEITGNEDIEVGVFLITRSEI